MAYLSFSGLLGTLTQTADVAACPGKCIHALASMICDEVREDVPCPSASMRCCVEREGRPKPPQPPKRRKPPPKKTTTTEPPPETTTKKKKKPSNERVMMLLRDVLESRQGDLAGSIEQGRN